MIGTLEKEISKMKKNTGIEKTYKDFKIGETVTCVCVDTDRLDKDFLEQHLTLGKDYIITDIDFHFPDSIVVKSDNGKISMFFPIECFTDDAELIRLTREKKLKRILKDEKF